MSHRPSNITPPTADRLLEIAEDQGFELTDQEVEVFRTAIDETLERYQTIDQLQPDDEQPNREIQYAGRRSTPDEDPLNAFITKCSVSTTETGPLAGYTVGVKDNVAVAGVELTCGSRAFEGYVPKQDATIVTRLLDAGATITGKTNMEALSAGGGGELGLDGDVLNPVDPDHLAGGSSSGSGAAVAAGEIDIGIGADQGGSIRRPAAWCGVVGHKPTFGLVPYTGIVGLGHTFDYVGPITRTVEDCALALDVIAGKDPLDPRQDEVPVQEYAASLEDTPEDLTIGVLTDGFDLETSDGAVDDCVRSAIDALGSRGAEIRELSLPSHADAVAIWTAIFLEEAAALVNSDGVGRFTQGFYDTQFARTFGRIRRTQGDEFPPTFKLLVLTGQYLTEEFNSRYYAKAQNLRRDLRAAYDDALDEVDLLALPTIQKTAHERQASLGLEDVLDRGLGLHENRVPFNVTGHPAVTVPCGTVEGLPVGLQFVGTHFDDATVLTGAYTAEQTVEIEM